MKILLLDIETAPAEAYIWNPRQRWIPKEQVISPGHTLCVAAKWYKSRDMYFGTGEAMFEDVWNLMSEADAIVHYNGNKFDIPTLNREFVARNQIPPDPAHQIDLYRIVKSRFKMLYNSLEHVCEYLGLGSKHPHKGMELWVQCLEGNPKAWAIMEKYNKQDVKLLEKLYQRLLPWIKTHPNHALYTDDERPLCTNCGSFKVIRNGTATTASVVYQKYLCRDCGTPMRSVKRTGGVQLTQDKR